MPVILKGLNQMSIGKTKRIILNLATKGVSELLGISYEDALKIVKESGLEQSIEKAPDLMLHYSKDQLVYEVLS
jgi:hypothetical protein